MKKFKIHFPAGYSVDDIPNDNIDVNVVLQNGKVYFGTLFTLENVKYLMGKENHFWSSDMIIVKNLEKKTIRIAITEILSSQYFFVALTEVGSINNGYFNSITTFDAVKDMT